MADTIRTRIGSDYEILAELGQGGMATVYKARHKRLRRTVALKILPSHLLTNDEVYARFEREAQAGAQLEHDHIVTTYDYGVHEGQPFLAVAFIEGETLDERLRKKGHLSPEETVAVMVPIAEALAYAHRQGVIHRDVKSSNIMIRAEGERPILIDFGIAQASFTHKLTRKGDTMGTPAYMSPEQAAARDIDLRTDLYSLGVVLYECLTGTVPFQSMHLEVLLTNIKHEPHRPVREQKPNIPAWLSDVVDQCLEKDPTNRFVTGDALADALRKGLRSQKNNDERGRKGKSAKKARKPETEHKGTQRAHDKHERDQGREEKKAKKKPVRRKKQSGPSVPRRKVLLGSLAVVGVLILGAVGYWLYPTETVPESMPEVLREALQNPVRVTELDLSSLHLDAVPSAIAQLLYLHTLNLGDNNLTDLPAALAQLPRLQKLYLWGNDLADVPEVLFHLPNLLVLSLTDNQLTQLPESLDGWSHLNELYLDGNQLESLPEAIGQLKELTTLIVHSNNLSILPDSIARLTNLITLNVQFNLLSSEEKERIAKQLPGARIRF